MKKHRYTFCSPHILDYPHMIEEYTDAEIADHLFTHYPTLSQATYVQTDYRAWRRCCIREGLKRGIISKDPGLGPPERR